MIIDIIVYCCGYDEMAVNMGSIQQFLSAVIATIASMVTRASFTLQESFLAPSLTNGLNFHCTIKGQEQPDL